METRDSLVERDIAGRRAAHTRHRLCLCARPIWWPATGLAVMLFLSPRGAISATRTVTNTLDSGPGSLRAALAAASDGDTIDASGVSGRMLLTSGELAVNRNVAIVGPGPDHLAVDGNASSRVFHIGSNTVVSISGLTITNGSPSGLGYPDDSGGGIYNEHARLTVSNCAFRGNSADFGGAILNNGDQGAATLILAGSILSGNWASSGGGLYSDAFGGTALVQIVSTRITGNSAQGGGGLSSYGVQGNASVQIVDSTLSGNTVTNGDGGGMWNTSASLLVQSCMVAGNSADGNGGGILNGSDPFGGTGNVVVQNSTLSGNSAGLGGGLYSDGTAGSAIVALFNSTISSNSATSGGGSYNEGFYGGSYALLVVENSTFSGNSAGTIYNDGWGLGGGIAEVDLGSTILEAGAAGANISNPNGSYGGTVYSYGYNLSSDDGAGLLVGLGDQVNIQPMLGPLQDNGGPTFTHALLPGSPAIDRGRNFNGSATDQRGVGFARTYDAPTVANATGGDGTDIGAFETQNRPPVARCQHTTRAAGAGSTAPASIDAGSFDPDGDPITLTQSPPGPYPLGTNLVTLTVTDSQGASDTCSAQVIVIPLNIVTTTADSGPGSLREALAIASDGGAIQFAVTGTILLTSGELLVSNSVNIVGPGPGRLAVDAQAASRVFHIARSNVVSISGLTITNGSANISPLYSGGGIWNDHSTLSVSNSVFSHNSAVQGGGICNDGSQGNATLTVAASTFDHGQGEAGGGIYNFGAATVAGCTFHDNLVYFGAGMVNYGTLTLDECTLENNTAQGEGGGIYNVRLYFTPGALTISNSVISGNEALSYDVGGGGIYNEQGAITVANTVVNQNSTYGWGGGIVNRYAGRVLVANSTVGYNQAGSGGGIANLESSLWIANSTLAGNSSAPPAALYNVNEPGYPSQVVTQSTSATIVNSTISGNVNSREGADIVSAKSSGLSAALTVGSTILNAGHSASTIENDSGSVTSLGYNLSSDNTGGLLNQPTDLINTDPMLAALANDGGLIFTLSCSSPAIDKGKNFSGSATDQLGFARTVDDPAVANPAGGDGTDIGALELQQPCNRPPVARCKNVTLPAGPDCTALASVDNGSYDPDGDPITLTQTPPGSYPLGTNVVTLTVTDSHGASSSCTALVIVRDTTPPALTCPANITVEFADTNGAVVRFAPTASDDCSGPPAVVSLPPSGSTFRIGTTSVACTATDRSGNSAGCGFSVTVLGARGVKLDVLADLQGLRSGLAGDDRIEAHGLDQAIDALSDSLAPAHWIDETHLQPKSGDRAMNDEAQSARTLQDLLKSKHSNLPADALRGLAARIAKADRLLALVAINEATGGGMGRDKLRDAWREVAAGDSELARGNYAEAIGHYRQAWMDAQHAQHHTPDYGQLLPGASGLES